MVIIALVYFNTTYSSGTTADGVLSASAMSDPHGVWKYGCDASPNAPVLVNVETKLGVNYNAGHWFHMSELIMTQHATLRKQGKLVNSSAIYVNFDKEDFIADLNAITRLIVYLGTAAPDINVKEMRFLSSKSLTQAFLHDHLQRSHNMLLDFSKMKTTEVEWIDMKESSVPTSARFTKPMIKRSDSPSAGGGKECVHATHNFKARWPTPQRGSWFPEDADVTTFRQKLRNACPRDKDMQKKHEKRTPYKLVIYQRDLSRKIMNEAEAIQLLRAALPADLWEISVLMHSSKRSPCELAHMLNDVDVLVTPHGFQSMLLLFLPRPALLFEVFPYRYWKRGYGPLSKEYGVIHDGVMSPGTKWDTRFFLSFVKTSFCMTSKFCRGYAREQDVLLTQQGVNRLVRSLQTDFFAHPAMQSSAHAQPVIAPLPKDRPFVHPRDFLYPLLSQEEKRPNCYDCG
eukprot:gene3383-2504_t